MDELIKRRDAEEALTTLGVQLSERHHRTVAKCICAIKDVPAAESSAGCEWCKSSDDNEYSMAAFVNPNNPTQKAILSVYGGRIIMDVAFENNTQKALMAIGISYCPMCGRKFAKEDIDGN